jgi:hypothetical protein
MVSNRLLRGPETPFFLVFFIFSRYVEAVVFFLIFFLNFFPPALLKAKNMFFKRGEWSFFCAEINKGSCSVGVSGWQYEHGQFVCFLFGFAVCICCYLGFSFFLKVYV